MASPGRVGVAGDRISRHHITLTPSFPGAVLRGATSPLAGLALGDQTDRASNASIGFEAGKLDHLPPFLSFIGNELAELRSRSRKYRHARVGKPPLDVGSAKPALISLLSLSMMSMGVFLGATMPHHPLAS